MSRHFTATLTRNDGVYSTPAGANGRTDPLVTTLPKSSYCVKQVQKIFVMPQKALKYKRFSAFGTFTNCQFLADPSCYFRDKIRHFLCSCEKVIKLPNNFDCLVVGDKHSINCVVHYLFESFIVH